ncbi:MAG TPA: hypothetical protein PLS77_10375 [Anaerolineaceae bacterium]|nr:hypothetical protein [Anaerolineaceae bacterium]HQF46534.1 hypothetical protein [Anaerolineaceae bacterium]HQH36100.1 hypothetical protein [Anaerolineaceae bacterium]
MTTTVLFIEHLISGIQAGIWLILFMLSILGLKFLESLRWNGYESLLLIILLSLLYPLGVFVDELADALFSRANRRIRTKIMKAEGLENTSFSIMNLLRSENDEYLANYLGYIRTRIRISRSAVVNFVLITISAVVFTVTRLQQVTVLPTSLLLLIEIAAGGFMIGLAWWAWNHITHTFARRIAQIYKLKNPDTFSME